MGAAGVGGRFGKTRTFELGSTAYGDPGSHLPFEALQPPYSHSPLPFLPVGCAYCLGGPLH